MKLLEMKPVFDILIYISIAVITVSLSIFIFRVIGWKKLKGVKIQAPMTLGIILLVLSYLESFSIEDENRMLVEYAGSILVKDLDRPFKYIFAICIAVLIFISALMLISSCIKLLIKNCKEKKQHMGGE